MTKINAKTCIDLLKKKFPKFLPYWDSYVNNYGLDLGLIVQMLPFSDYAVDIIKSKDNFEIKNLFDVVEFILCNGDDYVQTAMTTSFLEYLMSKDSDEIQFVNFVKCLGANTIKYCKAWDKFSGIKTAGLW